VWAPVKDAETSPVTVVEETKPWSDARRHGAEEAHSLWAPQVEEPEKVAAVEEPDDTRTPAQVQCSVQVVAGPRVVREEALESRVARRGAPGPRVARPKAPSPRRVRRMVPEAWLVQEEA
jgi:hypothetical protein